MKPLHTYSIGCPYIFFIILPVTTVLVTFAPDLATKLGEMQIPVRKEMSECHGAQRIG